MKKNIKTHLVWFMLIVFVFTLSSCTEKHVSTEAESADESPVSDNHPVESLDDKQKDEFANSLKTAHTYRTDAQDDVEKMAIDYVTALFSDTPSDCLTDFPLTDEMKAALDEEKIVAFKKTLTDKLGNFNEIFDINSSDEKSYRVVRLASTFEFQPLTLTFRFDENGNIAGFVTEVFTESAVVNRTEYAIEKQVVFGEPGWALNGLITVPSNQPVKATVILVHGSGPNDKDETLGPNKPFKDIALGLARNGIATFRYDKRTYTYASKLQRDTAITPDEETIDDVIYASQYLRLETGLDTEHLYVLGHSLGGYFIPKIDETIMGIDGYIFMNANARPLQELVMEQYQYLFNLDGELSDTEKETLDKIAAEVEKLHTEPLTSTDAEKPILGAYRPYWQYLDEYKPLELVQNIKVPMLFVQGSSDYQVTSTDFETWQNAVTDSQDATFISLKGLNHLMMPSLTEKSTPDDYYISGNVSDDFIKSISEWISNQQN